MPNHDAIIIGTGQSGPALAQRLVAAGQNVAIVERKLFGGTCVNTGCTPTKTLIACAYAAHLARRAGNYGVTIGGPVGVDKSSNSGRVAKIRTSMCCIPESYRNHKDSAFHWSLGCRHDDTGISRARDITSRST